MKVLPLTFFARDTSTVAHELLGKVLVRELEGFQLRGMIVEAEAYIGQNDTACHARRGRTKRNAPMFGPPGQTYLYYIYGMHWMLNLVTEREGFPAAVLLRALEPLEGQDKMRTLRTSKRGKVLQDRELTNGPARLTQALALDKTFNAFDLTRGEGLWLEEGFPFPAEAIQTGPRIGIGYADLADQITPWRFWLRANPFVSR